MQFVGLGDVAAFGWLLDVHLADCGAHSAHAAILKRLIAPMRPAVLAHFDADALGEFHVLAQILVIIPGDVFVAASSFHDFRDVRQDWKTRDQKNVGAEIRHAIRNVQINAGNKRDHQNQRRNRKDNSQEHQERAQLVFPKRGQCHGRRFTQIDSRFHVRAIEGSVPGPCI